MATTLEACGGILIVMPNKIDGLNSQLHHENVREYYHRPYPKGDNVVDSTGINITMQGLYDKLSDEYNLADAKESWREISTARR